MKHLIKYNQYNLIKFETKAKHYKRQVMVGLYQKMLLLYI
jgi:hypothetical protein